MKFIDLLKKFTRTGSMVFLLLLSGCNSEGYFGEDKTTTPVGYDGIAATDILQLQLSPVTPVLNGTSDIQIPVNTSMRLRVLATLNDYTQVDLTSYVTWDVTENILSVDNGGRVLSSVTGSTNVIADYLGVKSNSVEIKVQDKTLIYLQFQPSPISAEVNESVDMFATAYYSDGTSQDVSDYVDWQVMNATTNFSINSLHQIKSSAVGTGTVNAFWGNISSNIVNINITEATPVVLSSSLKLIPTRTSIPTGLTSNLQVIATYPDGSTKDVSQEATYIISDTSIVSLSEDNQVIGNKVGSTSITASFQDRSSNSVLMTVTDAIPLSLTVTSNTTDISKGLTSQLQALVTFSDNTVLDVSSTSIWSVDDANIATVDSSGSVLGLNVGIASIKAQYQNVLSNSVAVNVADALIQSLQITPSSHSIPVGGSESFIANAIFTDILNQLEDAGLRI